MTKQLRAADLFCGAGGMYFNEHEPFAADWCGNIYPDSRIDKRSIKDVQPIDLARFRRCHFFAGVGTWEYALQLADWPADHEVWTGSCPCQPFSAAGKRKGTADERHLWPEFLRLITECRPATIFGEQVASNDGRDWLAGVRADLEALGYAFGAADLCSAGTGEEAEGWIVRGDSSQWERIICGPNHIRQRLYWAAHASGQSSEWRAGGLPAAQAGISGSREFNGDQSDRFANGLEISRHANASEAERGRRPEPEREHGGAFHVADGGANGGASQSESIRDRTGADSGGDRQSEATRGIIVSGGHSATGRYADSGSSPPRQHRPGEGVEANGSQGDVETTDEYGRCGDVDRDPNTEGIRRQVAGAQEPTGTRWQHEGGRPELPVAANHWSNFDIRQCLDGKARRIESGLEPLVDGVAYRLADGRTRDDTSRAKIIKCIGNGIVPQVAAVFVRAITRAIAAT